MTARPVTFTLATALLMALSATSRADPKPTVAESPPATAFVSRFYAIAGSGQAKSQDGFKMCVGAEFAQKMVSALQDPATRQAVRQVSKGCTNKIERPTPGTFSVEIVCLKSAGAVFDSRMTMDGSLDRIHQHMEMSDDVISPSPPHKVIFSDTIMTHLGPCPANVNEGQFVDRDGKVSDPRAGFMCRVP